MTTQYTTLITTVHVTLYGTESSTEMLHRMDGMTSELTVPEPARCACDCTPTYVAIQLCLSKLWQTAANS